MTSNPSKIVTIFNPVLIFSFNDLLYPLEDTARYACLLLAPAEASGFGSGFVCSLGKKKLIMLFCPIFGVTLVKLNSNL